MTSASPKPYLEHNDLTKVVSGSKPRSEPESRGAKVLWSLGKRSASLRRSQGDSTGSPAGSQDTPTTRAEVQGASPNGRDKSNDTGEEHHQQQQ